MATDADPSPTRKEHPRPGPSVTRRERVADALAGMDLIPPELAERLASVERMMDVGGEADLFLVVDSAASGAQRVLKVYRPGFVPDPEVWKLLEEHPSGLVEVFETGHPRGGRAYELQKYYPAGSLRALGVGSTAFPADRIESVVRQLVRTLGFLHDRRVTHRDVKPDNVLVRDLDPLAIVLTDFGLAQQLDQSIRFSTVAGTDAYAAPEAQLGVTTAARDLWSLGMIVREMATGVRYFRGIDDQVIREAVNRKPIPVDGIADPRLRNLAAGLLVIDRERRWGRREVTEWLDGGSPVVPSRGAPSDVRPLSFGDAEFRDPEALAEGMAGSWTAAVERFTTTRGEAWEELKAWLRAFDDPEHYPREVVLARQRLIDEVGNTDMPPEVAMGRLIGGLAPALPATYAGQVMASGSLITLAHEALADETSAASRRVDELWIDRVLPQLASRAQDAARPELAVRDDAELAEIDRRWRGAMADWQAAVAELRRRPGLAGTFDAAAERRARAALLAVAAGDELGERWASELRGRAATFPVRVRWFDEMLGWAQGDPVRLTAAWAASGAAAAEADREHRAELARQQAHARRLRAWADSEAARLAGRSSAVATAVGGVLVVGLLGFVLDSFTGMAATALLVGMLVVLLAAELWLALALGRDYHPRYSLIQGLQLGVGAVGDQLYGRWLLGLVLAGGAVLALAKIPELSAVLFVAVAVGHVVWAGVRGARWSSQHAEAHKVAISG